MNPRIQTIAPGVTSEVISLITTMMYEPKTKGVTITFGARPCIFVNDDYQGPGGDQAPLTTMLTDIASRRFGSGTDPVTQADLSNISAAGAVLIIKAAFAALYDEAQAVPPPVANIVETPQPGATDA